MTPREKLIEKVTKIIDGTAVLTIDIDSGEPLLLNSDIIAEAVIDAVDKIVAEVDMCKAKAIEALRYMTYPFYDYNLAKEALEEVVSYDDVMRLQKEIDKHMGTNNYESMLEFLKANNQCEKL